MSWPPPSGRPGWPRATRPTRRRSRSVDELLKRGVVRVNEGYGRVRTVAAAGAPDRSQLQHRAGHPDTPAAATGAGQRIAGPARPGSVGLLGAAPHHPAPPQARPAPRCSRRRSGRGRWWRTSRSGPGGPRPGRARGPGRRSDARMEIKLSHAETDLPRGARHDDHGKPASGGCFLGCACWLQRGPAGPAPHVGGPQRARAGQLPWRHHRVPPAGVRAGGARGLV
jgi:hypothetical protein